MHRTKWIKDTGITISAMTISLAPFFTMTAFRMIAFFAALSFAPVKWTQPCVASAMTFI
jgi:hypothetical protein